MEHWQIKRPPPWLSRRLIGACLAPAKMYSARALKSFLPGWSRLYPPGLQSKPWLVEKIQREKCPVSFYETVFIARQDITTAQVDGGDNLHYGTAPSMTIRRTKFS